MHQQAGADSSQGLSLLPAEPMHPQGNGLHQSGALAGQSGWLHNSSPCGQDEGHQAYLSGMAGDTKQAPVYSHATECTKCARVICHLSAGTELAVLATAKSSA